MNSQKNLRVRPSSDLIWSKNRQASYTFAPKGLIIVQYSLPAPWRSSQHAPATNPGTEQKVLRTRMQFPNNFMPLWIIFKNLVKETTLTSKRIHGSAFINVPGFFILQMCVYLTCIPYILCPIINLYLFHENLFLLTNIPPLIMHHVNINCKYDNYQIPIFKQATITFSLNVKICYPLRYPLGYPSRIIDFINVNTTVLHLFHHRFH